MVRCSMSVPNVHILGECGPTAWIPQYFGSIEALYNEGKAVLYGQNNLSIRIYGGCRISKSRQSPCAISIFDHTDSIRLNNVGMKRVSRPPTHLFHNFHIQVKRCQTFNQMIRLQERVQALVMLLNRGPEAHVRGVTFVYEHNPRGCGRCPRCNAAILRCEEAGCPGTQDRREKVKRLASQLLAPFRFMRRVVSVTALCPLDETLIEKIKSPDKSADLFPRYLPLLKMFQQLPQDKYFQHVGFHNARVYGQYSKDT